MNIYLIYERTEDPLLWSSKPWSSSNFVDIGERVECAVLADSPREAAEKLGLGECYVEETYDQPGDNRWRGHSSHTIQLGLDRFTPVGEEDGALFSFLASRGEDAVKFNRGPIRLIRPMDGSKAVLEIQGIPLIETALVVETAVG